MDNYYGSEGVFFLSPPAIACFSAIGEVCGLHNFHIGVTLYFVWIVIICISEYYRLKTYPSVFIFRLQSVGSLNPFIMSF
jgi:hypothetical protein